LTASRNQRKLRVALPVKLLRLLRAQIWAWVPGLVVVSLALGCHGYYTLEPKGPFIDHLYRAMALFVMEDGGVSGMTWPLNVARFLAPITLTLAAVFAFLEIFWKRLERFLLRYNKDHVVLCGLGAGSLQLARDFRKQQPKKRIVIIDNGQGGDLLEEAEAERFQVLSGTAHGTEMLKAVRVERAAHVVMLCEKEEDNIRGAMEVFRIHEVASKGGHARPLELSVHIHNDALRKQFMEHKIFRDQEDAVEVKVFSAPDTVARLLLRKHPLEVDATGGQAERTHLMVVGFDDLGQALAGEALFTGHYANLQKLKLTVVDRCLRKGKARFRYRYPGLDHVCEVTFQECDVNSTGFDQLEILNKRPPEGEKLTVALCLGDDMLNFSTGLKISSLLKTGEGDSVKILFKAHDNRGVAQLLDIPGNASSSRSPPIIPYGMAEEECNYETVIAPGREKIAEAMHNKYFEKALEDGAKIDERPALNEWHNLPPYLQDSNRWQFEHLHVKIRLVDPRFANPNFADGDLATYAAKVSIDEFQKLSEPHKSTMSQMEHARWCAEKWLTGWKYDDKRNDDKKLHHDLLHFDELSKDTQQKDTDTVDSMTDWLNILREHNH
jgi:hypothetical protein